MSYEDTLFVTNDHGDYRAREGTIEIIYDQLKFFYLVVLEHKRHSTARDRILGNKRLYELLT